VLGLQVCSTMPGFLFCFFLRWNYHGPFWEFFCTEITCLLSQSVCINSSSLTYQV
jgi:hypothetical protein